MLFRCFFILCFTLFCVQMFAGNVVYVVVDGVSRHTLYPMIKRGKLPGFQQIIDRGNYRNVGIREDRLLNNRALKVLYFGDDEFKEGKPLFVDQLKLDMAQLDVKCFFSTPLFAEENITVNRMLETLVQATASPELKYRQSTDIARLAVDYVREQQGSFVLMLNFTNVNYFGWKYREGAHVYAKALMNVDAAIEQLIAALTEKGVFEDTEFLITTTHGYKALTPHPEAAGWVIASRKALRKGTLDDIIPSVRDLLNLPVSDQNSLHSGRSLFR